MRRTRIEHILSALPQLATEERTFGIGSSVPIGDIAGLERDGGAAFCFGARMINIKGKLLSLNTAASNSASRWIIFHKLYG
jgi:hypothetical protein